MVRTVPMPGMKVRTAMDGMATIAGVNAATDVLLGPSWSILRVVGPTTQKPIETNRLTNIHRNAIIYTYTAKRNPKWHTSIKNAKHN
jgi:hypothetical protein